VTTVLAIDPGNIESAWVVVDATTRRPLHFDKQPNADVLRLCYGYGPASTYDHVAVEMIRSYGMAVGAEVFETCVWIGRFTEALSIPDTNTIGHAGADLIYRADVKLHHCRTTQAKDTNVRQALVDRFAPGQPNHGKGTKTSPGWFHGFRADVWQAYALAVLVADTQEGPTF
jgi:hypothetical protein